MKTVLALAPHPNFADAISNAGWPPAVLRVVHRLSVEDAEPLLRPGLIDACIVDADLTKVSGLWPVERIRRLVPDCPLILYANAPGWEWEEEAYAKGVAYILNKPVRGRMLVGLLERLWEGSKPTLAFASRGGATNLIAPQPVTGPSSSAGALLPPISRQSLPDLLALLGNSLSAENLLKEFLLLARQLFAVNRAAIFLRRPSGPSKSPAQAGGRTKLEVGSSLGFSQQILRQCQLSLEAGIGRYLVGQGGALRRHSEAAQSDGLIQQEFELLAAEVAIPILDREELIGIGVFGGTIVGGALSDPEIELLFHLLENLGLGIKNVWIHAELVSNHDLLVDVLQQLDVSCVVIGNDLAIRHANKAALASFARAGRRGVGIDFDDLPELIGSKVYQVFRTGVGINTFKYAPAEAASSAYYVTIVPLLKDEAGGAQFVLLLMENRTQAEQIQRLEIEAANLRLVKTMAERLAHEIGNSIVPLSTHEQLMQHRYDDADFRASLSQAMNESVKRISRLAKQMFFLARENFQREERVPVRQLVEEAFHEAQNFYSGKLARLQFENGTPTLAIAADHAGLRYTLSEIILNALQAHDADSRVNVQASGKKNSAGEDWVDIEVTDPGPGFSEEGMKQALDPFYTSRGVGLGLGLTVARKIIEKHRGRISIAPAGRDNPSQVIISIPAE